MSDQGTQNTESGSGLYTRRSMESLSAPEHLKSYLQVTGMPVWIVVITLFIVVIGLFVWSSSVSITSYTPAAGVVKNGTLTVALGEETVKKLSVGSEEQLLVRIGETQTKVSVCGKDAKGRTIATGEVSLPDGRYRVQVGYDKHKAIALLLD